MSKIGALISAADQLFIKSDISIGKIDYKKNLTYTACTIVAKFLFD